jgi:hypothetical protein
VQGTSSQEPPSSGGPPSTPQKLMSNVPAGHGAHAVVATPSQDDAQRTTLVHGEGLGTGSLGVGSPQVQVPAARMSTITRMITRR